VRDYLTTPSSTLRVQQATQLGSYLAAKLDRATGIQSSRVGHSILLLQQQFGNRYVQRVMDLARKGDGEAEVSPEVEEAIQRARGGGQALDGGVRAPMESAFGADFGRVRVHTDAEADTLNRALSARAFTTGQDIFFRRGEYSLASSSGRELLAHELTHVVQQTGGLQCKLLVGAPGDVYEQEADRVAQAILRRGPHMVSEGASRDSIRRQPEEEEEEDHDLTVQAKQVAGQTYVVGDTPRVQLQPAKERTYTVQAGDSLAKIAAKFAISVQALKARNDAKLKTWPARRGIIQGFEAGEIIVIPVAAAPIPPSEKLAEEKPEGGIVEGVTQAETTCSPKDPPEVIACHNRLGTFGKGVNLRVTSTKRDQQKQLNILRNYCKANKAVLDKFAENTEWLKGELDWKAFETCSLSDQEVWLPFFFALFYGGGGPGTKSDARTLPLVGSPVQAVWKGRTANASPHLAGRAMDVVGGDLETVSTIIKTKIPEFGKAGQFPIRSTQIENVSGQKVVHINFQKIEF